jgi:hypothetical protein
MERSGIVRSSLAVNRKEKLREGKWHHQNEAFGLK